MVRRICKGPMSFGSWALVYEERDKSKFELSEGEELYFDRERGFFTWMYDFEKGWLLIPKMCGDGRYFRRKVFAMVDRLRASGVPCVGAYCVTKRRPEVYMRVLGGELVKQEVDEQTGVVYSYILVTPENTNVKR